MDRTNLEGLPRQIVKAETRQPQHLELNLKILKKTVILNLDHDFIGKEPLIISLNSGSRWLGLVCQERGPNPRPGHMVFDGPGDSAKKVGYVTSGGPSPSLNKTGIAMGYFEDVSLGQELWIQASSRRRIKSIVVKTPFV